METSKKSFQINISKEKSVSSYKIICKKCAGSGNFKTPENSRRTCLVCFGKGYLIS